jgi:hypothetical protein
VMRHWIESSTAVQVAAHTATGGRRHGAPRITVSRSDMSQIQRSRTRNGERFRASSDHGAVTIQEIITETDASSLDKPGTWVQGLSEFLRMDKGTPLNCNDARTEFTDPVDGTVYRRRL